MKKNDWIIIINRIYSKIYSKIKKKSRLKILLRDNIFLKR